SSRRSSSVRGPDACFALARRAAALRSLRVVAGASWGVSSAWASVSASAGAGCSVGASSTSSTMFSGVSSALRALARVDAALARDGQRSGQATLGGAQRGRVLQLARGVLEAQAEQLAPLRDDVLAQPAVVEIPQLGRAHHWPSSRRTNLVFTGSL